MRGRMPLNNMKEAEGVSTFFVTTKGRVRLKKVMNTLSLSLPLQWLELINRLRLCSSGEIASLLEIIYVHGAKVTLWSTHCSMDL